MKKILFLLSLFAFLGCHTNTYMGGTYYEPLQGSQYKVYFKAGRSNDDDQIKSYLLYKAAQVAIDKGYKYFAVIDLPVGPVSKDEICYRDIDNDYPFLCSLKIYGFSNERPDLEYYVPRQVQASVKERYPDLLLNQVKPQK